MTWPIWYTSNFCAFFHTWPRYFWWGESPQSPAYLLRFADLVAAWGFPKAMNSWSNCHWLLGNIRDFKATLIYHRSPDISRCGPWIFPRPIVRIVTILLFRVVCFTDWRIVLLSSPLTGGISVIVTVRFRPWGLQKSCLAANPIRSVMRGSGSSWIFLNPLESSWMLMPCRHHHHHHHHHNHPHPPPLHPPRHPPRCYCCYFLLCLLFLFDCIIMVTFIIVSYQQPSSLSRKGADRSKQSNQVYSCLTGG